MRSIKPAVALSSFLLAGAGGRASALPAGGSPGGRSEAARCASLTGPSRASFTSAGLPAHPRPPGVRSSSQWSRDPGAPPFEPAPKGWRRPAGVSFQLLGAPRVEGERIILKGELVNASKTEQRVYLWEAGMGYFGAQLLGSGVARRPPENQPALPEIYPATGLTVLPAGVHWLFEIALILPCYTYTPGQSATVDWSFNLADQEGVRGQLPVKLP
jgi:hypothetical protein